MFKLCVNMCSSLRDKWPGVRLLGLEVVCVFNYFQSAGCTILCSQKQYVLDSVPFCLDLVLSLVLFIKKKKMF